MSNQNPDVRIFAEFYMEVVEDENATAKEGRPMFKEIEHVRIRFAGDNKKEFVAPAHSVSFRDRRNNFEVTYAQRFSEQYEAFKKNQKYIGNGTPLEEAPFLTSAQRAELKAINIFTIESLANPTSQTIQILGMGGRALVNKAVAWLEQAADAAPAMRFATENAELKNQLALMQKQIQEIAQNRNAAPVSQFQDWDDDQLKTFIKDKSGQAPRGTPSHETLVRMADEASQKVAA